MKKDRTLGLVIAAGCVGIAVAIAFSLRGEAAGPASAQHAPVAPRAVAPTVAVTAEVSPASDRTLPPDTLEVRVLDTAGRPVEGAAVGEHRTDHGGRAVLRRSVDDLLVSHPDFHPAILGAPDTAGHPAIDVVLRRGGIVRGRVMSGDGRGIPGVEVRIAAMGVGDDGFAASPFPDLAFQARADGAIMVERTTLTGETGEYAVSGLVFGEHVVEWSKPGYIPDFEDQNGETLGERRVAISAAVRELDLTMLPVVCGAIALPQWESLDPSLRPWALAVETAFPNQLEVCGNSHPAIVAELSAQMRRHTEGALLPIIACLRWQGDGPPIVEVGVDALGERVFEGELALRPWAEWRSDHVLTVALPDPEPATERVRFRSTFPLEVFGLSEGTIARCYLEPDENGRVDAELGLPCGEYVATPRRGGMLDVGARRQKFSVASGGAPVMVTCGNDDTAAVDVQVLAADGTPTTDYRLRMIGPSGPCLVDGSRSARLRERFELGVCYTFELSHKTLAGAHRVERVFTRSDDSLVLRLAN